jgi:hypothetical protein
MMNAELDEQSFAGSDSLDELLRQFPSVMREQAHAALGLAREALVAA